MRGMSRVAVSTRLGSTRNVVFGCNKHESDCFLKREFTAIQSLNACFSLCCSPWGRRGEIMGGYAVVDSRFQYHLSAQFSGLLYQVPHNIMRSVR